MSFLSDSGKHLIGRQERYARYRGTARVNISYLRIDRVQQGLNSQRVESLRNAFAKEGCHRLEPSNRIAALVSQQELATLASQSNISQLTLLHGGDAEDEPPQIIVPADTTLRVIHGRHRLEAAKSYFPPDDAWWTVDLFLDDLSPVLITSLRQEYSDPKVYSDGEVFRQIRLCHQQEKIFQEMKWWACLTKDKSNDLKKIIAVKELREGFDDLLDVTGLWDGFRIGKIRRYLFLKCHEVVKDFRRRLLLADRKQELSMYLRRIHHVWSRITSSRSRLMNLVDAGTVRSLESRAPAASSQDAAFVKTCMDSGKIFAQVLDPGWRKTIITNICAVERVIPSLWTFIEHTKHLAPCARAIKVLLELHQQTTIYGVLSAIYAESSHDQQSLVRQDGECHFVRIERGDKDRFEFSYRQLWMFAMRHFSHLVSDPVVWEHAGDPSCDQMPGSILWYRFAQLAFKLGFRSRRITLMGSASTLDRIMLECISWVAGAAKGGISPERQVAEIRERLQIETNTPPEKAPSLTTEDQNINVQKRLGNHDVDYPQKAKLQLFVRWLYDVEEPRGKFITLSFIQRAVFHAFFGHSMRSRDEGTISYEQNETENQNISQDTLPVPFSSDTYGQTGKTPQLGDYGIVNYHPSSNQGSADPRFVTCNHINPLSDCSSITSPRDEERGSQRIMADMTMILQEPTRSRNPSSQECIDYLTLDSASMPQAFSSPTVSQNSKKEGTADQGDLIDFSLKSSSSRRLTTAELATPTDWGTNLCSPLSPLTLAQRRNLRQSMLKSSLDNAMKIDTEERLSSSSTSVFEIATISPSSSSDDLETLFPPDNSHNVSAFMEQGSAVSESPSWSPASMSHFLSGQKTQRSSGSPKLNNTSYLESPIAQIEQCKSIGGLPMESTELVSSCLYPLSGQETLEAHAVTKGPTKRIREIVEESLSCVHDSAKHPAFVGERKSHKRTFQEYSACLQSVDTQRVRTYPRQ